MKLKDVFVYRVNYGFGYGTTHLQNWVKLAVVVILVIATAYSGWRFWNYLHDYNHCDPPYHLVYTGTAPELVGKVVVTVNQYECVS